MKWKEWISMAVFGYLSCLTAGFSAFFTNFRNVLTNPFRYFSINPLKTFGSLVDLVFGPLDAVADCIQAHTLRVAGRIIIDTTAWPASFNTKVCTLESAAKRALDGGLSLGIKVIQGPPELDSALSADAFINRFGWYKFIKEFLGGRVESFLRDKIFRRVLRFSITILKLGNVIAIAYFLHKLSVEMAKEDFWKALPQDSERVYVNRCRKRV